MSFDSDHFGCILTTSLLHSRLTCRCENQTDGERNPKGELLSVEVKRREVRPTSYTHTVILHETLSQREIRTLQNCLRYSKKIIMKKPSAPRSDVRGLIPPMKFVSLLYFMSETTCDFFSTEPPVIISMEYFRNTSRI